MRRQASDTGRRSEAPPQRQGPSPIYAVFGSEDFLRRQALRDVTRLVLGPDPEDMAIADFEGPSAELADVLDECRMASLMAPMRLVCVHDADKFITRYRGLIERYLEAPSTTGVLVLMAHRWNKSWRLNKIIDQLGGLRSCESLERKPAASWASRRAQDAYGCGLGSDGASRLVDLVGTDMGRLDSEIAKLATFIVPRTEIQLRDVELLVGASRAETVFKITDAIAQSNAPAALGLWEQLVELDKAAPYRAVGGLAFGFRRLLDWKRKVVQGLSIPQLISEQRLYIDPRSLKQQLDRFSLRQWQDHLVTLMEIDLAVKTGLGSVPTAVERFIVDLCGVENGRRRVAG